VRDRFATGFVVLVLMATPALVGQQPAPSQAPPLFRSGVNLVLVDVVVRDRNGLVVKGLTANDFELIEDGTRQQILTFAFEEISTNATPVASNTTLTAAATVRPAAPARAPGTAGAPAVPRSPDAPPAAPAPALPGTPDKPLTSEDVAGHRLLTLLFDTSSMQPEDVQKAVDSAITWVDEQMTPADLVAVASIGASLRILTDFTSSKEQVTSVLTAFSATDGTAFAAVDASTAAIDETQANATDDSATVDQSAQELDTFNNDVRLRALKTLAEALKPIQQKKAIIYFSSGMQRNGTDNQVELRAAVNAAVRANVAIYPVDARGLQAIVPGGGARQASKGGLSAFTGSAVANQFSTLQAQQETLTTLASDTGGTAFTDTNDFSEAFTKVTKDISSYYILGFASTNANKDGRFRRLSVRLKSNKLSAKVEAREGYYADRDFTHTAKGDRELLLQEQLLMQIPATDVPLFVTAGWFRLSPDKYYVPVSLVVPGDAVPPSKEKVTLDVAGFIRDERGVPVGRIRDTLTVPPAAEGLEARQVLYQTGVTLPPGRFSIKIVVRENTTGRMGTFETPMVVPELKQAPVKVSSLVLSTQLQNATGRKTASPLVRDGVQLVPNLTHIVGRGQKLYFYYEVYDPAAENGLTQLRTSLAFYRGKVKVFETPVVERTQIDATDRHAAIFQFEVPADSFKPGLYTCQINIIDEVAGHFAFPRLEVYVR
jgi:VWFA-related protein